jgi:hypothetical protein
MSVRADLLERITAAAPGAHIIAYQDAVDVLDRITIMFKQLSLSPLPAAPRGAYRFDFVLTVCSPALDPQHAELELDDFVPSLLGDLDTLDWFAWDTAEKVLGPGALGLAYDIHAWTVADVQPDAAPAAKPKKTTRSRKEQ